MVTQHAPPRSRPRPKKATPPSETVTRHSETVTPRPPRPAPQELEWRNGYFHRLSKAATAEGLPDPFPLHTAAVRRLKLEPKLLPPRR